MKRIPEPELMDLPEEVDAYARADFREVNARFVDRLKRLANPLGESLHAVDLGCGPGDIPILAAQRSPRWTITAVDASAPMLETARANASREGLSSRIAFHLSDASHTGLGAGAFDVVFSNSLLHHVADPFAMWREIGRLARPGRGVLFLRDLLRPASEHEATAIVHTHAAGESQLLREEFHRSLLSAYTVEEVCAQLVSTGLTGLTVERTSDRHLDVWGTISPRS